MRDSNAIGAVDFWSFGSSQNCTDQMITNIDLALYFAKGVWVRRSGRVNYVFDARPPLVSLAADLICEMILELPHPDAKALYLMETRISTGEFEDYIRQLSNDALRGSREKIVYTAVRTLCAPHKSMPLLHQAQHAYKLIDDSGMRPKWREMLVRRLDYYAARKGLVSYAALEAVYAVDKVAA